MYVSSLFPLYFGAQVKHAFRASSEVTHYEPAAIYTARQIDTRGVASTANRKKRVPSQAEKNTIRYLAVLVTKHVGENPHYPVSLFLRK